MEKGKYINIVFYKYILLRKNSAIEQRLSAPVKINLFSAQHTKKKLARGRVNRFHI